MSLFPDLETRPRAETAPVRGAYPVLASQAFRGVRTVERAPTTNNERVLSILRASTWILAAFALLAVTTTGRAAPDQEAETPSSEQASEAQARPTDLLAQAQQPSPFEDVPDPNAGQQPASPFEDVEEPDNPQARRTKFYGNFKIKWLYVVPKYPCQLEDINFKNLKDFDGYSNHCPHLIAPLTAAILGAEIIEVHITADKSKDYLDNNVSFDYKELKSLVSLIHSSKKIKTY